MENFIKKPTSLVFCSRECYEKDRRSKRITKKCLKCGKDFFVAPHEVGKKKHCSLECYGTSRKGSGEYIKCKICKKEVYCYKKLVKRRKYCSQACLSIAYREKYAGEKNPNYKDGRSNLKKMRAGTGNNLYKKGIEKENEAKRILEEQNYWVISSAASRGIFDLYAIKDKEIRLIQVKLNRFPYAKDRQKIKDFQICYPNCKKEYWTFLSSKKEPIITDLS